jgi:hypothetical protein
MITIVSPNPSRQAVFAMPTSRCDDAAWLRALPTFTGEVSVLGADVRDRIVVADAPTFLGGTPAWSPPT